MLTAPQDVLAVLSFGNAVIETTSDYFDTIHTWMPFISHKRMNLGIPLRNAGPDLAMLFLAMKLVTSPPAGTGLPSCDPLYTSAKAFLALFEANGEVSLLCLQAMVLIALYEHGHAVYPTAWMTVGACVRYAEMLGITHSGPRPGVLDQVARPLTSLPPAVLSVVGGTPRLTSGDARTGDLDGAGRAKTPLLGHLRARPHHSSRESEPICRCRAARRGRTSCRRRSMGKHPASSHCQGLYQALGNE